MTSASGDHGYHSMDEHNEQASSWDWNPSQILQSAAWPFEHEVNDEYLNSPLASPGIYTSQGFDSQYYFDQSFSEALQQNSISPSTGIMRDSPSVFIQTDPQLNWIPDRTQGSIQPIPAYVPLSAIHNPLSEPINSSTDLPGVAIYSPRSSVASTYPESNPQSPFEPAWQTPNEPASRRHSNTARSGRHSSQVKEQERRNPQIKRGSKSGSSKGHQLRSTRTGYKINYSEKEDISREELAKSSRNSHNMIEKQYRTRLNGQFSTLLGALPVGLVSAEIEGYVGDNTSEKKVSKSDVLVLAKRHIESLERENTVLEDKNGQLAEDMQRLQGAWVNMGGQLLP